MIVPVQQITQLHPLHHSLANRGLGKGTQNPRGAWALQGAEQVSGRELGTNWASLQCYTRQTCPLLKVKKPGLQHSSSKGLRYGSLHFDTRCSLFGCGCCGVIVVKAVVLHQALVHVRPGISVGLRPR